MAGEQWLSFAEAVQLVRERLDCSTGRAESIVRTARSSGEVRYPPQNPVLIGPDDGLMDFDMRHAALPSKIEAPRNISANDLLDWLDRTYPQDKPAAAPGRRGAKAKADWEAVGLALRDEVKRRGAPGPDNDDPKWRSQADVERWTADFLDHRQESVAESTIRDRIRKTLQEIEAGN